MNNKQHRYFSLINACSLEQALSQVVSKKNQSNFDISSDITCIDMTHDFNQNKWLGQELGDCLIYFDDSSKPNGLLAVLGCVKAPHKITLSCDFNRLTGYFKKYILLPKLQEISLPLLPIIQPTTAQKKQQIINFKEYKKHKEIEKALSSLCSNNNIIHLIGERGSGKSTLLGLFLSEIKLNISKKNDTDNQNNNIVISAHNKTAVNNIFNTFSVFSSLPSTTFEHVSRETLQFYEPQQLLKSLEDENIEDKNIELVIIDEAATFPKKILKKAIDYTKKHKKRLILSTTIEGYEGTGQSYRLNYLSEQLKCDESSDKSSNKANNYSNNKQEKIIFLKEPKRFSSNDPLYKVCQSLYFLHTDISVETEVKTEVTKVHDGFYFLSNKEMCKKGWIDSCFSLLQEAHYKTTPNDLELFYNQEAYFTVLVKKNCIIGAAYALPEQLPEDISVKDIFYGKRRIKNAFTHQSLINTYGINSLNNNTIDDSLSMSKILRISRIAVVQKHRRKRIATQLISHLLDNAINQGYDFLSTSFSGSEKNIQFWLSQDFSPARLGLYPNKANNEYAILMLKGISEQAQQITQQCCCYFNYHIQFFKKRYPLYFSLLQEKYRENKEKNKNITITDNQIREEIKSVTDGYRDIHNILPIIYTYIHNLQPADIKLSIFKELEPLMQKNTVEISMIKELIAIKKAHL